MVFTHDRPRRIAPSPQHRSTERLAEPGKLLRVWLNVIECSKPQPLSEEAVNECAGLWIAEHPAHLLGEISITAKRSSESVSVKLVVGQAAPQEVRKSRGELEVAHWVPNTRFSIGVELDPEEEVRRDQDGPQGVLDRVLEIVTVVAC